VTNLQLYFAAGLPTIAVLIGILLNAVLYSSLGTSLNACMSSLENRMTGLEAKFDLLIGKLVELDNRLTRLDERLERR
jgi:hypothetical protein